MERVRPAAVVAHDWWVYLLVSGAGGKVVYDPEPSVRYRQHHANLIGGNLGLAARLARLRMLAAGRLAEYSDVNLAALDVAWELLTPEARAKVALMRQGRRLPLAQRLACLRRIGLYRQTRGGTVTLWLAFVRVGCRECREPGGGVRQEDRMR